MLPRLVNALAEQGELVLVLDDFHRLTSAASRESLAWFVDALPATLQLVLSTRADPALPLGALRAHGQLLELRADDLRFTRARGARVPQRPPRARARRRRRRPARRADRGLARRASTWPRCRWRASRTRPGWCGPSTARARTSSTSSRARCSAPTSPSCRRSCSAPRCWSGCARRCATRCSASAASAAALESLARTNLFLVPLDDQRRWFRFHHLFAQLLRVELERREPAAVPRPAPARVRVARRVRHDRRGDPPRARGGRVRRGRRADRRDAGSTTSTRAAPRPSSTGCALPGRPSTPTPACCSSWPGSRPCAGSEHDMRRALAPPATGSAGWRTARSRTASPRSSPASAC